MSNIQTYSGIAFDPLHPRTEDIRIRDIAHALSLVSRFTGHTTRFLSVAEHSINVMLLVPNELKLAALLHDASEAYLADIATPVKHSPEMVFYREAEARLQEMIYLHFGVCGWSSELIKKADRQMLCLEAKTLIKPPYISDWNQYLADFDEDAVIKALLAEGFIGPLGKEPDGEVEEEFLYYFEALCTDCDRFMKEAA